jgi:hypothetical protein
MHRRAIDSCSLLAASVQPALCLLNTIRAPHNDSLHSFAQARLTQFQVSKHAVVAVLAAYDLLLPKVHCRCRDLLYTVHAASIALCTAEVQ